jgi:hypothetical protein
VRDGNRKTPLNRCESVAHVCGDALHQERRMPIALLERPPDAPATQRLVDDFCDQAIASSYPTRTVTMCGRRDSMLE